jgi:hypothetical protein
METVLQFPLRHSHKLARSLLYTLDFPTKMLLFYPTSDRLNLTHVPCASDLPSTMYGLSLHPWVFHVAVGQAKWWARLILHAMW